MLKLLLYITLTNTSKVFFGGGGTNFITPKRCFMKTGGYDARSSNKSKVPVLVFKKKS